MHALPSDFSFPEFGPLNTFCVYAIVFVGRPGMFSMKERAKWDAWKAVEGN